MLYLGHYTMDVENFIAENNSINKRFKIIDDELFEELVIVLAKVAGEFNLHCNLLTYYFEQFEIVAITNIDFLLMGRSIISDVVVEAMSNTNTDFIFTGVNLSENLAEFIEDLESKNIKVEEL